MLEIQKEEINNVNHTRKTKKTQIFLYDTQRRYVDFLSKLKFRHNLNYEYIPHYIITKSGQIIETLDPKYSTKIFNDKKIDNKLITIALENLGWLTKNTITGILHNWIGDPFRGETYTKKWRDSYFWDPYSSEQINSLVLLTQKLCNDFKIPYQTVPSQGYLSNVIKFKGIVCKSNFSNIYKDINPSFKFEYFYEKKDK